MSKEIPLLKEAKYVEEGDDVCISMDAEMFKDMFSLMSSLILLEVQVKIERDGLKVRQMDEAHIALTDMFIPKSYFKVLKAGQKIKELRLPVAEVRSILTRLSHGDVIVFTVTPQGKLHVEIKGKRVRAFNLPLLESEVLERREPKVPLSVRIKTTMEGLLVAIEDAQRLMTRGSTGKAKKNIYGQVSMTTTPVGLKVESKTEDELYSAETILNPGWDIMKFEGGINQRVTVSIPYLVAVIKAVSRVTNIVQIEFATDMPVHIVAELPFKDMSLSFWLAPRVHVDEKKEVRA